jgi:hypothetical protein
MIRTLAIMAAVSFALAIGCFAGAFAIAGGPFSIDENWRYHADNVSVDIGEP